MGYLIFLRLIHIVCAIFWAGGTLYLAGFVIPAVKAMGPDGGKFMAQLSRTNKLPVVMMIAATVTVLGGILLIERLSDGFQAWWFGTPHGIIISTGATLALIGYIMGLTVNLPAVNRMSAIAKSLAASGAPPTPDQMQEMQKLRTKLFTATNILAVLLLITAICMSIVRYF